MSRLDYHLINAFILPKQGHSGNQASVVFIPSPNNDRVNDKEWMRFTARDFGYSETAFLVPLKSDSEEVLKFGLRWYTPEVEVSLCGHATLASAYAVFDRNPKINEIHFQTRESGTLIAQRKGDEVEITLPAAIIPPLLDSSALEDQTSALSSASGLALEEIVRVAPYDFEGRSIIYELKADVDLKGLKVDVPLLARIADGLIILTQRSSDHSKLQINSRVFVPGMGIDEDPVTGAAHVALIPYYHQTLSLPPGTEIDARQVSEKGGAMKCVLTEDGKAVKLLGRCWEFGRGSMPA